MGNDHQHIDSDEFVNAYFTFASGTTGGTPNEKWSKACKKAFQQVKQLITSGLLHYDPNRPLWLANDVSPYGLGNVLSQIMETADSICIQLLDLIR